MGDSAFNAQTCYSSNTQDYMRFLSGPLQSHELDFMIDALDQNKLKEYQDFEPQQIMAYLINRASAQGTSPDDFHKEIRELIFLRKLKNNRRTLSQVQEKTLYRMECKYSVRAMPSGIDSVTHLKLTFLFPHFSIIPLMPFFSTPAYFYYGLPKILIHPEFGGLIPSAGSLDYETWRIIVCLHLWCLTKVNVSSYLHPRTLCVMLRKRMDKSQLCDDRRIRFLQLNYVLKNNKLLADKLRAAFPKLPPKFIKSVFWSLID